MSAAASEPNLVSFNATLSSLARRWVQVATASRVKHSVRRHAGRCKFVSQSVCLRVCVYVYIYIYACVCVYVCLPVRPSDCLSVCLSVYVCVHVCMYVSLYVCIPLVIHLLSFFSVAFCFDRPLSSFRICRRLRWCPILSAAFLRSTPRLQSSGRNPQAPNSGLGV